MSLSLGEKLRQAREERGISISEVAEQTRISPLYLKSIEIDDYKPLPGGIFNKGFLRSYARYIGFDEEEALQEYSQLMAANQPPGELEPGTYRPEVWTDDRDIRSFVPTIIFAVVILVLFGGGLVILVRYLTSGPEATPANISVSNSVNASNAAVPDAPDVTAPPQPSGAFSVELKTTSESVWVGYTVDGNKTEKTLNPGESLKLDVQESVKFLYARVKAASLEFSVNGKRIDVPTSSSKGNIEIEINKANVSQIFQTGRIGGAPEPRPTPAAAATPRPSPRPVLPVANAARPSPAPTAAGTPRRPTQ